MAISLQAGGVALESNGWRSSNIWRSGGRRSAMKIYGSWRHHGGLA